MKSLRSTIGSVAIAGFALAVLAGCSAAAPESDTESTGAAPAPSEQTAVEACGILQEGVTSAAEGLQQGMAQATTDPNAAIASLQSLVDAMDGALGEITNEDVTAAGTKARDSLAAMVATLGPIAADPNADQTALNDAAQTMQADFTAIGDVC